MTTLRNLFALTAIGITLSILTGCQTIHQKPTVTMPTTAVTNTQTNPVSTALPATPQRFDINGKIGITTPQQAGSAFYTWGQNGQAFSIDLAGALNAGQTQIRYNGQTATLTNDKGTLTADSPEALLFKATKWQAPISQLPYWIMGQPAPSDTNNQSDSQNRLTKASNGDWTAEFGYANTQDKLPNRITARHPDGYKVVMTINRLN